MAAIARAYALLLSAMAALAALLIAFAAFAITIDVVLRNAGAGALAWVLESVEYSLFALTFMGAPWVLHINQHVRVDVVVNTLPRRAAWYAELAADLLGLVVSAVLLFYAVRVTVESARSESLIIKEFIFPEWWLFSLIILSLVLLVIEFIRRFVVVVRSGPAESA